jgi:hypothetical protein
MKLALTLLLLLSLTLPASDEARSDGWAGMVLDVSTPEDAVRLFGKPAKEKQRVNLELPRPLSWLSDKYKQRVFRTLTYKKLHEYEQVWFGFLDARLVAIILEAPNAEIEKHWIDPDDLEDLFAVVFKPHMRQRGRQLPSPSEFQNNAPTELKKDDYDYWYDMIAVSEKSIIVAVADNYKYGSFLFESPDAKRRKKINSLGARYPGYVNFIEILSRSALAR